MWTAFFLDGESALLLSAAALGTALLCRLGGKRLLVPCAALLSVAAAFAVYSSHHQRNIAPFQRASGRLITVEGIVLEAATSSRATDYVVDAVFPKVNLPPCKASVRIYGESQAAVGDAVRCRIELYPAEGAYYTGRGIRARGIAKSGMIRLEEDGYRFARERLRLRSLFTRNLYTKLPGEAADLVGTMVMKIGSTPDSSVYSHMNRTGISHLLAISGLHFSILSTFLLQALRKLSLPRRVPELATILFSLVFVVLTGFSPSIIRAFVMFFIMILGQFSFRRGDAVNSLRLAMLAIGALWPDWTQSIGLWLSAASTLGILTLGGRLTEWLSARVRGHGGGRGKLAGFLASSIGVSLSAYLFTLPLLVLNNGWIPLLALPANILVSPFVTPLLLGGILCSVIPASPLPVRAAALVTDLCARSILRISQLLSELPFATASIDHTWKILWLLGAALIAAATFLAKPMGIYAKGNDNSKNKDTQFTFTGLAGWAAMLCVCSLGIGILTERMPDRNRVELVTLNRCASSLLLRGDSAVVLGMPGKYDAGLLMDYLDYRGVRRVSALIAPEQRDTVGSGALRLAEGYPIDAVIGPDDAYRLDQLARAFKGVPVYSPVRATVTVLGGVSVTAAEGAGELFVRIGGNTVEWADGLPVLPAQVEPVPEPLGEYLYGEARYLFEIR